MNIFNYFWKTLVVNPFYWFITEIIITWNKFWNFVIPARRIKRMDEYLKELDLIHIEITAHENAGIVSNVVATVARQTVAVSKYKALATKQRELMRLGKASV